VWWILATHAKAVREQQQVAQQEAHALRVRRMQRLAKELKDAVDTRTAQWVTETGSAVPLLETIERLADKTGLQWVTKSAEERLQTNQEPPRIILTATVEGDRDALLRFLREVEKVEGEPHLAAVSLGKRGEEDRWRGSLKIEMFRVPHEAKQEGTQPQRGQQLGDPFLHP
jgi:hypothetical protein